MIGTRDIKYTYDHSERSNVGWLAVFNVPSTARSFRDGERSNTFFSKLTFDHSRLQVSRVKQGTLTLPENLVPHHLQEALIGVGCSLAYIYITYIYITLETLILIFPFSFPYNHKWTDKIKYTEEKLSDLLFTVK